MGGKQTNKKKGFLKVDRAPRFLYSALFAFGHSTGICNAQSPASCWPPLTESRDTFTSALGCPNAAVSSDLISWWQEESLRCLPLQRVQGCAHATILRLQRSKFRMAKGVLHGFRLLC